MTVLWLAETTPGLVIEAMPESVLEAHGPVTITVEALPPQATAPVLDAVTAALDVTIVADDHGVAVEALPFAAIDVLPIGTQGPQGPRGEQGVPGSGGGGGASYFPSGW